MAISVLPLDDRLCHVIIDGAMTVDAEMQLQSHLLATLAKYHTVEVDLASVSEINASALHVLACAKILATLRGKSLNVINPSHVVLAVLGQVDLKDFFCGAAECH